MIFRTKKENELLSGIILCIGSQWPASFVPQKDLTEAVNEFLQMPAYDQLFGLIKTGKMKLHVNTNQVKEATGCWLSFSMMGEINR